LGVVEPDIGAGERFFVAIRGDHAPAGAQQAVHAALADARGGAGHDDRRVTCDLRWLHVGIPGTPRKLQCAIMPCEPEACPPRWSSRRASTIRSSMKVKTTGMMSRLRKVDVTSPPITAIAIGERKLGSTP